ncbi:MAG: DUF302 domain-containing protein [Spirochaetes bacterium]|jgi:uncharacterized protein (DUF302 family)|nr:DUF302 domain-containing protein [Spirochaetota bacterium]
MRRKLIAVGAGSLIAGILLTLAVGYYSMPGVMMLEDASPYPFDETVQRFEQEVNEAGWGVLVTHDMQEILEGHGHDVAAVKIFELCSSRYSAEVLSVDDARTISPLMPCRVAIYQTTDGTTYISRMNSQLMAKPFGGVISRVMDTAAVETEEIIESVLSRDTVAGR